MSHKLQSKLLMTTVATLLLGIGIVAPHGLEVRAVTTFSQIGSDINGETTGDNSGNSVALSADGTRIAIGANNNDGNGDTSGHVRVYTWDGTYWTQTGADINGEATYDGSGYSVAISADGSRIAIGARGNDGGGLEVGHVRVYTWDGTNWTQTGADINGETMGDNSGWSVAMSTDGTRIAIGAIHNDGSGSSAGHVRVYTWSGTSWMKTGSDIDGEAADDNSGRSVAMSTDGTRIAIGANGNNAGYVRIYTWNGTNWTKTGADINGEAVSDGSGRSVAMSADGSRVAIGATGNDGNGNGAGHVRIYSWDGTNWTQTGSDIDGETTGDNSGYSVAMSTDGSRIAIGANNNDGNGSNAGHVRIYSWDGTTWIQTGTDIDGEAAGNGSGYSVAMSTDGSRIAIGAIYNGSNAGHVRIYAVAATPSTPTISSVTAADGSLTVAFTAGTNGGSPITNYKYSVNGTDYTALNPATTTSPFTISGLTNATTYSVTIKAMNAIGDSVASNAITGTPVAPAATPTEPNNAPAPTTVAPTTTTVAPTTTTSPTTTTTVPSITKVKKAESLPETGDNSSMIIVIGLLFTATGLVLTSRRRINR